MSDLNFYLKRLLQTYPLREPVLKSVIEFLQLPKGSRGLDVGCGIGLQTILMAKAISPDGHVTGLDIEPKFLDYAQRNVDECGMSAQISFQQGSIYEIPFKDNSFDWLISIDCAGYLAGNSLALVKELSRVVKPGGTVAFLSWASQQLLPGFPILEAKLNITTSGLAPFKKDMAPEKHFLNALGWLKLAGLQETKAESFAGSVHAPLSDEIRDALTAMLDMRWESAREELNSEDWAEFQRLSQPESPDFILNHPDYFAFFVYSLFCGKVAV